MRGFGNVFKSWGVLVVNAREEKFKFVLDWMDAKGKKDIIDNMHEHKIISTNFGATTSEHHYFMKFWQ